VHDSEVALRANQCDILAYLVRRVDNREDAADLFGDAYLTAWRKRRQMPSDAEGARRWLFVIARNTLLNHYSSSRRRRAFTAALRDELRTADVDDPTEHNLEVREAIAALAPEQTELVRLIHWEGFGVADAGAILGLGASTARSRYAAARAQLSTLLTVSAE
jgi:RNA polymerase sigma-70 factor (ECF subfamily)